MCDEAPTPTSKSDSLSINLELDHKNYILDIKSSEDTLIITLNQKEDKNITYKRNLSLNDLKQISQFFIMINSCKDFALHLKKLSEEKKLSLNKKSINKINLCFTMEYFSRKQLIEISLYTGDGLDANLEERIKKLEIENKELKKEIEELKKIIEPINKKFNESFKIKKHIFNNNSVIMNPNEFDLIHLAIKSRLDKQVKELRKL